MALAWGWDFDPHWTEEPSFGPPAQPHALPDSFIVMPHTTLALIKIHFTDHKVHWRGDLGGFSIFTNCATITKINSRTTAPRPVLDVSRQRNHTLWVLLCLPLSLSIMFSGSLHVVMSVRASPLFLVEGHSRVEGHVCSLGCVGLVAVMSLAAVDACVLGTRVCVDVFSVLPGVY